MHPVARIIVALVVLGTPMLLGSVHCVTGSGGPTVCWKEAWGFSDTFVDSDDYIGQLSGHH